jgi:hypothetical protein
MAKDDEQLEFFQKVFLKAHPNPERKGCPGAEALKTIARQTHPGTHPGEGHLGECSPCFADYLAFRQEWRRLIRLRILSAAVAASLLVASFLGFYFLKLRQRPVAEIAEIVRTVDLSEKGALRGASGSNLLEAVSLPAGRVRVIVILPKMSGPGVYIISVSRDQNSQNILAHGRGLAQGDDKRRTVSVLLDLRKTKAGSYFLTTTHDDDESSYYYPLNVEGS